MTFLCFFCTELAYEFSYLLTYLVLARLLTERRMYWCDGHTERIEVADMDGGRRQTLFAGTPDADPFGIAVQGSFVYWTDWAVRGLFRARRDGTGGLERLLSGVFRGLNDVKYFNRTAALGRWQAYAPRLRHYTKTNIT